MLLFRCVAGSRLYGTSTPTSDWDWIEVHDHLKGRRKPLQTIVGDQDCLRFPLSAFMELASRGNTQALDAMFAPADCVEVDKFTDLRRAYRVNTPPTVNHLRSMATSFLERPKSSDKENAKDHRAAYRCAMFLREVLATARYHPRLDPDTVAYLWESDNETLRHDTLSLLEFDTCD